jgi:hypothetical protein
MATQTPHSPLGRQLRPMVDRSRVDIWPALPLERWRATYQTLHLCAQMVGKVRLALTPKENQWWNVPFYLTARGLTTSPMPYLDRTFEIEFDLVDHDLVVRDCEDRYQRLPLAAESVADFHEKFFAMLRSLDLFVSIRPKPVEIPWTTPFNEDKLHGAYEPEHAATFFRMLRRVAPVFERFRAGFRGKCSPVHFFWGSFDLAVTRFSGRPAPLREGSIIERDAYDEEVISLGFWPGDAWGALQDGGPTMEALFYAYVVPEPPDLSSHRILPEGANYSSRLKEFILPYEDVRGARDPAAKILAFAESTYDVGATLAGWDKASLAYPSSR